jgi:Do/DeqQ family serine protease
MPSMVRFIAAFALILLPLIWPGASPALAQKRAVPSGDAEIRLSFAPIVRRVGPAVVNIYTKRVVKQRPASPFFDDPFFRRFFGESSPFGGSRKRMENSLGSGVIVRGDGVVVTNHHVIKGADSITVVLSDRREFDAKVLVTDEQTDIAVLRVGMKGETLPSVSFGDADSLEVGDLVLAIGNPFGLGQTVSSGIVSGLARTSVGITDFRSFIQTDAAINPGNSGGALVSMDGRLIGINTAIYSRSGGSVGIGFAVPSTMVRTIVRSAVSGKPLVRPWLSMRAREVTSDIASAMGLARPGGVLVESVTRKGPAARAGIRRGDVIVAINEKPVDDVHGMRFRLATREIGERVKFSVQRKGNIRRLSFELQAPPEDPPRNLTQLRGRHPLSGAHVVNLSPAVAAEVGLDDAAEGVLVVNVARGSWASRIGLRKGDILLTVNDSEVRLVEEVRRATNREQDKWRLEIRRGNRTLRVEVG